MKGMVNAAAILARRSLQTLHNETPLKHNTHI